MWHEHGVAGYQTEQRHIPQAHSDAVTFLWDRIAIGFRHGPRVAVVRVCPVRRARPHGRPDGGAVQACIAWSVCL